MSCCHQAFDQQQQDLVDAASKALSYRQDIIEENIRLAYQLQVFSFLSVIYLSPWGLFFFFIFTLILVLSISLGYYLPDFVWILNHVISFVLKLLTINVQTISHEFFFFLHSPIHVWKFSIIMMNLCGFGAIYCNSVCCYDAHNYICFFKIDLRFNVLHVVLFSGCTARKNNFCVIFASSYGRVFPAATSTWCSVHCKQCQGQSQNVFQLCRWNYILVESVLMKIHINLQENWDVVCILYLYWYDFFL